MNKVIQLRGTSGSGKTTAMRKIMKALGPAQEVMRPERRQPFGYVFKERMVYVPGHYNTACGGCDTINGYDLLFGTIKNRFEQGYSVIYEGLLVSGDIKRISQLHEQDIPLQVFSFDVPIEVCIDSINERRRARNPDAGPVNPENTIAKHRGVIRGMEIFKELGIPAEWVTRENVVEKVLASLC